MSKIKYIMRVLRGVSFQKIFNVICRVKDKTGKNKILIFLDMLVCAIRYGAGYYDYLIFGFYDMNHEQRKTYVTRVINKKLISQLNNEEFSYIFDEKNIFNKRFKKYLHRDYLDLESATLQDFKEFMEKRQTIFAKPSIGESGKGIEKLNTSNFSSIEDMFNYIKNKNFGVIEELIIQHEALSRLYPLSINSLRIVTIVVDGVAHCVYAVCKMGNEGKFVDNMENSGLCCPIDLETGKINGVAHTSKLINYECHPYTGVKLEGYQLPYVKEAIDLCLKAALEIEQIKYVGWDVCIMEDGPAIIEGNDYPGYDFWQLPEHTPDKIGLLPFYKKLMSTL